MNENEKKRYEEYLNKLKKIEFLVDMIHGDINRICVTDSLAEYEDMCGVAKRHLDRLADMAYETLMIRLAEKEESEEGEDKE